jgi:hypothetical protein
MRSLLGVNYLLPNWVLTWKVGRWWRPAGLFEEKLRTTCPSKVALATLLYPLTSTMSKSCPSWSSFRMVSPLWPCGSASVAPELRKRAYSATAHQVKPAMASGHTVTVVAKGLGTPREMVFDPLGNMLVVNQGGGEFSSITLDRQWRN